MGTGVGPRVKFSFMGRMTPVLTISSSMTIRKLIEGLCYWINNEFNNPNFIHKEEIGMWIGQKAYTYRESATELFIQETTLTHIYDGVCIVLTSNS